MSEKLIGMCSRCRWLGYCEERENSRRRRILICDGCRAEEAEHIEAFWMQRKSASSEEVWRAGTKGRAA